MMSKLEAKTKAPTQKCVFRALAQRSTSNRAGHQLGQQFTALEGLTSPSKGFPLHYLT